MWRKFLWISYRNAKEIQAKNVTPMSVEPSTPMSVDKSTMEVDLTQKSLIRNDRDRFFEVVEYQKDILQYLKQLEVSSKCFRSLKRLYDRKFYSTEPKDY